MTLIRRLLLAATAVSLGVAFAVGTAATAAAAPDLNCSDFEFQEDAQAVLDADPSDPNRLDGGPSGGGDGIACESLRHRPVADTPPTTTPPQAPPTTAPPAAAPPAPAPIAAVPAADRDCPDFATQAEAQAALNARAGDPERLDADNDGIACEQEFGTEGQQVAVFPNGGVATGGNPTS